MVAPRVTKAVARKSIHGDLYESEFIVGKTLLVAPEVALGVLQSMQGCLLPLLLYPIHDHIEVEIRRSPFLRADRQGDGIATRRGVGVGSPLFL